MPGKKVRLASSSVATTASSVSTTDISACPTAGTSVAFAVGEEKSSIATLPNPRRESSALPQDDRAPSELAHTTTSARKSLRKDPLPVPVWNTHLAMDRDDRGRLDNDGVMRDGGVVVADDGRRKVPKKDEFYKYWDRFLRVKEKSKAKSKNQKKEIGGSDNVAKSRTSSASGNGRIPELPPTFKQGRREGPSLDRDVEGRPGHPMVRSNTEGVISRYV